MGRACRRPGPHKHSKTCQISFYLFQRPATSFQPAGSVGWAEPMDTLAPETFENLSNLSILLQRPATSIQPAGSVGRAEPVGAAGPRNIRKTCQTSFFFQRAATSFQPAGLVGWAEPEGATFKNLVKPLIPVS